MSHQIDPLILQKLALFSQRRRKLIIFRGVCAALATLLLTMMLVALIDAIFVLPDVLRWGLSLAAYVAVIVVEWRSCLRLLMHAPDPRRLARLVEHAEPKLREDLISAVELGDAKSDAEFDSEEFRSLVQTDVAHRMEGMDMERLLPMDLVRRYIALAIVIGVVCVAAFALSGFQFGTLMLRALIPGANLARVSQVKVRVVTPESPDKVVAQGETEPLVIEISGHRVNAAKLETVTAHGRDVLKMTPVGPDRFSATIQVGREDVIYRVFAGDAVTKKYRLEAVARPHVVKFEKAYSFPAYTKMDPRRVTEENGDLAALEGTEVELSLETNQKIKNGELRVEQGKQNSTVQLTAKGNRLVATVPLTTSGTYRVHLVGADTGFENKFSPEYELRAEPDLVPQITLEFPKQDLILPANAMVDVQGTASDDQALARVGQWVKINDGKWTEVQLALNPGQKIKVERRWDLFEQGVKPGDLVTTKLVAVDLKGSRAESRPLQVTITRSGFESNRLSALEAERLLYEALKTLRTAGDALEKHGNEARDQFEHLAESDPQRKQVAIGAATELDEFEQKAHETWAQLEATLKNAEAGHTSADLVQIGRLLSRMDAGAVQVGKAAIGVAAATPEATFSKELMREFAESGAYAGRRARLAEEAYGKFLYSEEVEVIGENLHVLAREQERLAELAANTKDDRAPWAQLANRLRVVLSETRSIEDLINTAATHSQGDRMKNLRKQIETARTPIEKALAVGEPGKALLAPIQNLAQVTSSIGKNALAFDREQLQTPVRVHLELLKETQPTYTTFDRLRQDLQLMATRAAWPGEVRGRLAQRRWELRGQALKLHGDLEETRADSDSPFVNDVRVTTLALDALRQASAQAAREKTNAQLLALDKTFRLLEGGHNIAEILDGLNHLAVAERWEIVSTRSRTSNPRDWKWIETRLRTLPDELGKMQAEEPLRAKVVQAQKILWELPRVPAWEHVSREMNDRFEPQREPLPATKDVEQVAAAVKQALDLLRKPIEEAREKLAELAPKLSELMAQLAKDTDELKKETDEQAQKTAEKKPEQAQADARQALAEQQKINDRVEAVTDALRADANKQDILKQDSRERARDADDALAMLKEPPPKAEQALTEAARAEPPAAKAEALKQAAQEQQKLADALHLLARHYEKAEHAEADETRLALRATEQETGIKEAMDNQFARAEQLAQMAAQSPEELLKKLEQSLAQNPAMQQELSAIARSTLDAAADKLSEASTQENQVAQQVQKAATEQQAQTAAANAPPQTSPPNAPQAPQPNTPKTAQQAAQQAAEAAQEAAKAAQAAQQSANAAVQSAKQAENQAAAQQGRDARLQAEQATQNAQQAAQSAQQAAQSNQPPQMAQAAQQAAKQAGEAAAHAQEAAKAAQQAQATAQKPATNNPAQQAKNQESAQQAGEAVKAAQQAVQAAQKAQAAAQQAAAMAQQPNAAQMAQNTPPTPAGTPPAPASTAGTPPAAAVTPPPAAGAPLAAPSPQLAQAAQQQKPIAQAANAAGEEISRAGRHEQRLQNTATGQKLEALGQEVKETATNEVPKAGEALAQAQQAAQAQPAVNAAKTELQSELGQLQAATGEAPSPSAMAQTPVAGPTPPPAGAQAQAASAQSPAAQPAAPSASPAAPASASPSGPPPAAAQAAAAEASPAGQAAAPPPSPQEQVWMARTLDALDAALHMDPPAMAQNAPGEQPAPAGAPAGQPAPAPPGAAQAASGQPPGQAASPAMAQAQQAMSAAAAAAAAAMRASRAEAPSEAPGGPLAQSENQAVSRGGAQAQAAGLSYGALAEGRGKAGEWGKLPKKVAEQLTRGQSESVAGEYRNQVETYYRVIAEKSKKP
ncbi:MAG: hypothetical protein QOE70_5011 [Chthoniobacter sp.]|jgi:hypothetical protein|nr:hypothetical protein [Chthoniobacter sp.]